MNKLAYIVFAAVALVFSGCNEKGDRLVEITGQPASLLLSSTDVNVAITQDSRMGTVVFKTRGGEAHIGIETNVRSWRVENTGSAWLNVVQDQAGITLTAQPNTGTEALAATVSILVGSGTSLTTATLQVSQRVAGDPEIELDLSKIVFTPKNQQVKTVQITTNQDEWMVTTQSSSFWLRIDKGDNNTLVLTPDPNTSLKNDTLIVNITAGIGASAVTEKLTVINEAAAKIAFQPGKVIFMNTGGSEQVQVTSTQPWQIGAISETWVSAVAGEDLITVTAIENPTQAQLNCRIPVSCGTGDNTITGYIDVIQWSQEDNLLVLEYVVGASTTITLPLVGTVKCTINWGDGMTDEVSAPKPTHRFAAAGTYQVKVSGTVTGLSNTGLASSANLLTRVVQWGRTGLTSMVDAFYGCGKLVSIPGDDYHSFDEVTTFESAFSGCYELASIPATLLVNASKAKSFEYLFSATASTMTRITSIPAGLFDHCIRGTNFSGLFWGQKVLAEIPADLFRKTTRATDFSYAFYGTQITTTPDKLFAYCPDVTTFNSTFAYSTLTQIQSSLFSSNVNVTDMGSVFQKCTMLQAIPQGLLDGLTEVTTIGYLFNGCEQIKTIPNGLFASQSKVTNAGLVFSGCKSLTAIPQGLFDKLTQATSMASMFQGCVLIKSIPAGLFKNNALLTNIRMAFSGCSELETIPGDIFNCSNLTSANNSSSVFQNCTSLNTVPAGLLDSFTNATGMATFFSGCTALTTIPTSLFDKCTKVNSFASTFADCAALIGESPYTEVGGVNVHLYERTAANGFKEPSNKTKCFNGCVGLSDWASIPTTWK